MPPAYIYDIWEQDEDLNKEIDVSCLLPTGILILLKCSREETITNIKRDLWKEAKSFPLFNQLLNINFYIFQCINQSAEQEELLDENRRLCDVKPFSPDLRVVRKAGDVEDKVLNSKIGLLINKSLHDFDVMKNNEVDDFRLSMRLTSTQLQRDRNQKDWNGKAMYLFPPVLEPKVDLPGPNNIERKPIYFNMRFTHDLQKVSVLQADPYEYPSDLVKKAIKKIHTRDDIKPNEYVLKVRGRVEFLLGNHPLSQYRYIRKIMLRNSNDHRPELILVHQRDLGVSELLMDPLLNTSRTEEEPPPVPAKMSPKLSWEVNDKVRVKIHCAWNVNVVSTSNSYVRVRAAIYHGGEQLGDCFTSIRETTGVNPEWNEEFEANITVANLPRMARLCILVTGKSYLKPKRSGREVIPLAWVNTTFFNYKNQLRMGRYKLYMWPALEDTDLNPLGTVESYPNHDDATAIEISFFKYSEQSISFPPFDKIIEMAAVAAKEEQDPMEYADSDLLDDLRMIVEKDPLEDLSEQERDLVWKSRQDCRDHIPHSLPRLLKCVQWDNSAAVAQMQALLQIWPELKPTEAMELLDYKYADIAVRKFAVLCLEKLTDSELSHYLLQLVQALKYETHLDCDLGKFLLKRALSNQRIGHFFFWHLRAEMHNIAVYTRFGLLLEAYCRGNIAHMRILTKQVESLGKMKMVNELIKSKQAKDQPREELLNMMQKILQQESYSEVLSSFVSPLSPSYKLKELKIGKCKFMKSKMRPLWLVFKNEDPIGDDIYIMFKNGDDLRQDMLTLQVFQIMDSIWQEEGLDLRLIPYKALATGSRSGLIELVTGAETIAKIQRNRGNVTRFNAAFQKSSLFEWLKKKNQTPEKLNEAIKDFTYSCAGYCVATYVLGIGDRHNDNIMIKETGQLFHIDFGHFLGNYKSKFGVKRERVPFVLTHDFVHVITRGKHTQATKEFEDFRECCESAFMILRRHGNLLITMFAMMLSSGIPELSDDTIHYLRETLVLDKDEDEARKHFQSKFNEALKNSWKTSVNWMVHHLAHPK
ncbi:phosphatidylinositol 4,5-bisphosphate 3-kinase catalytic subunit beta isoform-like isoform X2 [Amphiura filiformis]|uniref:phosphatidylinositol 4,5-bisphosphate 3-kinase catalytic subunit beta isoform-like isoform X2 n=1 Tax=Amphiura filiformis TaxID=82378 RepID=UPI003B22638C